MELHSLGHGLFTYLVLQGLSGEADLMPSDGNVSAHEIIRYAAREIPAFSKDYLGESQVPTAFALGSDFIVGRP